MAKGIREKIKLARASYGVLAPRQALQPGHRSSM